MSDSSIEDLLARLERERQLADRLYNDALTAVDRAIQSPGTLPDVPPAFDARPLPDPSSGAHRPPSQSLAARLARGLLRLAGVSVDEERRLMGATAERTSRIAAAQNDLRQSIAALQDQVQRELGALARFESLLVQYLQTVTAYVDTKDRALGGSELRDRLAMLEQRVMAIKRELEREASGAGVAAVPSARVPAFAGNLDSSAYVGFEDRFRGRSEEILGRVEDYAELFTSSTDVLDVGCGRGELLELLRARGIPARGVEANETMAALCRSRGLEVERSDALGYLERQPDASLGGLSAIQVVEHFEPGYLVRFLEAAYRTMRRGAPLVLETLNPACWMAFFECYIRDVTHERPLHPDTLRFLVEAAGFTQVDVQYRQPVRDADRLDRVAFAEEASADANLVALASALNAHADKLNARLFSSMDYAVIARR